ncbi:MAG: metallophosphoesterase [Phycisphaerae bacterium]
MDSSFVPAGLRRMDRRMLWLVWLALVAGCTPTVPRGQVTFANLAGIYYAATPGAAAEAAMTEAADTLLERAVADLNGRGDLDFVLLSGDLLARADGLSLDRLQARLAGLKAPYYVVLGDSDGPADDDASASGLSRSTLIWAFQGHGFDGPRGYWAREVIPGLMLVGLDTAARHPGAPGPSETGGRGKGHVDRRQLEWLDRTLAAHWDKAVLVAAHHGLVPLHPFDEGPVWRDLMVDNAEEVREVLARHENVLMVLTGHHHFAGGQICGRIVYLSSPSVSVWPLAYHLVRLTPKEAEAVWVPLAEGDLLRRAQERLLGSKMYRGVFPPGEDGDTACVRLFGGKKMEVYRLPAIRP